MTVFKFHNAIADSIHVSTTEDGAKIRFDGNTLGINPSTNHRGYSITNDWNNRHFTIGFGEDSVLYHLTREDIDDRKSEKSNIPRKEFVAEMYAYVRSVAHPIPESHVEFELVGTLDLNAAKKYLIEHGIVEYTSSGLSVDNSRQNELIDELEEDPTKFGELLTEVLDPLSFDKIRDSDEIVFIYPSYDGIYVIFVYPENYVGVVKARNLLARLMNGGGSQIIDHVLRSVTID